MRKDDIAENVLKQGKEGVKQNIIEALDEFCDDFADEMWMVGEEVIKLRAENAALREQISKMIMPPCTLGDTLYIISFCFGDGYDETGKAVHQIGWKITETKVDEKNFYHMCDLVRNRKALFSREAAEARLAELKGEKE